MLFLTGLIIVATRGLLLLSGLYVSLLQLWVLRNGNFDGPIDAMLVGVDIMYRMGASVPVGVVLFPFQRALIAFCGFWVVLTSFEIYSYMYPDILWSGIIKMNRPLLMSDGRLSDGFLANVLLWSLSWVSIFLELWLMCRLRASSNTSN